jgi:hypothetical protein
VVVPSKKEQAQVEVTMAVRLMRQADAGLKDVRLALIRAERILGADESQNAIQSQRILMESLSRDLSAVATSLEVVGSSLHPTGS